MTETSPITLSGDVDDPVELKAKTVGRAMDHTEVKIVDPNDRLQIFYDFDNRQKITD